MLNPKPRDFADCQNMQKRSDDELFKVISEGGEAVKMSADMQPWGGTLSDAEIHGLVKFVRSFCKRAAPALPRSNDGRADKVRAVIRPLTWFRDNVPCLAACPVKTDAGRYVQLIGARARRGGLCGGALAESDRLDLRADLRGAVRRCLPARRHRCPGGDSPAEALRHRTLRPGVVLAAAGRAPFPARRAPPRRARPWGTTNA